MQPNQFRILALFTANLISMLALGSCRSPEMESVPPAPEASDWTFMQNSQPEAFIFRREAGRKIAALTFDDGPSDLSDSLIDLFAQHRVAATFFWQGNNLEAHEDVLLRALKEGHTVGQHSWDHSRLGGLRPQELWESQVKPTNAAFLKFAAHPVLYYRPPYGQTNSAQARYLRSKGLVTVGWSLTSDDWDNARNSSDEVVERVLSQLHPGAIVLLHDYSRGENNAAFVSAVQRIIEGGKAQGYVWVGLEELLQESAPSSEND